MSNQAIGPYGADDEYINLLLHTPDTLRALLPLKFYVSAPGASQRSPGLTTVLDFGRRYEGPHADKYVKEYGSCQHVFTLGYKVAYSVSGHVIHAEVVQGSNGHPRIEVREVVSELCSTAAGQQPSVRVASICSIPCDAPPDNSRYSPFAEVAKAIQSRLNTKHKVTGPGMFAVGTGHVEWRTWLKDHLHPSAPVPGLQLEQLCIQMHQHLMTDARLRSQGGWATCLAPGGTAVVVQRVVLPTQHQHSISSQREVIIHSDGSWKATALGIDCTASITAGAEGADIPAQVDHVSAAALVSRVASMSICQGICGQEALDYADTLRDKATYCEDGTLRTKTFSKEFEPTPGAVRIQRTLRAVPSAKYVGCAGLVPAGGTMCAPCADANNSVCSQLSAFKAGGGITLEALMDPNSQVDPTGQDLKRAGPELLEKYVKKLRADSATLKRQTGRMKARIEANEASRLSCNDQEHKAFVKLMKSTPGPEQHLEADD